MMNGKKHTNGFLKYLTINVLMTEGICNMLQGYGVWSVVMNSIQYLGEKRSRISATSPVMFRQDS